MDTRSLSPRKARSLRRWNFILGFVLAGDIDCGRGWRVPRLARLTRRCFKPLIICDTPHQKSTVGCPTVSWSSQARQQPLTAKARKETFVLDHGRSFTFSEMPLRKYAFFLFPFRIFLWVILAGCTLESMCVHDMAKEPTWYCCTRRPTSYSTRSIDT